MISNKVENTLNLIWFLLIRITFAVGLVYVIWRVRSVLIAIILSAMLAYVLLPTVEFITSKKFLGLNKKNRRVVATILVFVAFFGITWAAGKCLLRPFTSQSTKLLSKVAQLSSNLDETSAKAQTWYVDKIPEGWRHFVGKQDFTGFGDSVGKFVTNALKSTLEWLGSIVEIALIPVLAFYFVIDSRSLKKEFIGLLPRRRTREAMYLMRETSGILQSYVVGQIIICILAGVLTGIVLQVAGMPYVLILAIFAGITRAIPVVGPLASGIPICILGYTHSAELGAFFLIFMVVMHFVESKFIMPILIGDRVKLHPAVILIVLLIGAELFGIIGMFLAAPIAAIIREFMYLYMVKPGLKKNVNGNGKKKLPKSSLAKSEIGV